MKRIIRERHLTPDEATYYDAIRERVEQDFPKLVDRHWRRMGTQETVTEREVVRQFFEDGKSVFDLAQEYGESEEAIEQAIRTNMEVKDGRDGRERTSS